MIKALNLTVEAEKHRSQHDAQNHMYNEESAHNEISLFFAVCKTEGKGMIGCPGYEEGPANRQTEKNYIPS